MSDTLAGPEMMNDLRLVLEALQIELTELRDHGSHAEHERLEQLVLLTGRAQEILGFDAPPTQSACPLHNSNCPFHGS